MIILYEPSIYLFIYCTRESYVTKIYLIFIFNSIFLYIFGTFLSSSISFSEKQRKQSQPQPCFCISPSSPHLYFPAYSPSSLRLSILLASHCKLLLGPVRIRAEPHFRASPITPLQPAFCRCARVRETLELSHGLYRGSFHPVLGKLSSF